MTVTDLTDYLKSDEPGELVSFKAQQLTLDLPADEEKAWSIWELAGHQLVTMQQGHQWWLGDWMLTGEDRFGETAYGFFTDPYFDEKTMAAYVRVAQAVPPEHRRAELSWTHHKIVAKLPTVEKRVEALGWAVNGGEHGRPATTRELERRIKALDMDTAEAQLQPEEAPEPEEAPKRARRHFRLSFDVMAGDAESGEKILAAMREAAERASAELSVELLNIEVGQS